MWTEPGNDPANERDGPMWTAFDSNYDGYNDSWAWDGDRDGNPELSYLNSNFDSTYEAIIYDQDENGRAEWMLLDVDNNGSFDGWLGDHDNDGRIGDYGLFDFDHN